MRVSNTTPNIDPTLRTEQQTPTQRPVVAQPEKEMVQRSSEEGPQRGEIDKIVEKMNEAMRLFNRSVEFEAVGQNRIVIRVMDKESGELIQQFPSERLVEVFKNVEDELGLLLDKKV